MVSAARAVHGDVSVGTHCALAWVTLCACFTISCFEVDATTLVSALQPIHVPQPSDDVVCRFMESVHSTVPSAA